MSSTRIDLLASAAQTATAQGAAKAVGNLTELAVVVDVTAASGTLSVFMQASSDGGTTWTDLPYELALVNAVSSLTQGTVTTSARNILDHVAATTRAMAKYVRFGDYVRAAYAIEGSGATFTFSVKGIGKN